jgi:hypothetical protein
MRNRKYPYGTVTMFVYDGAGEPIDEDAANGTTNRCARIGKLAKVRDHAVNLSGEPTPQFLDPRFIVQGGLDELFFRLRMKRVRDHPNFRRSRANTSSPGIS